MFAVARRGVDGAPYRPRHLPAATRAPLGDKSRQAASRTIHDRSAPSSASYATFAPVINRAGGAALSLWVQARLPSRSATGPRSTEDDGVRTGEGRAATSGVWRVSCPVRETRRPRRAQHHRDGPATEDQPRSARYYP
jgi:hypothetical protein